MASLQMNEDLGLSKAVFGGKQPVFVGYFLFEVPSNLAMQKIGAKIWISRIMVTWGIVSVHRVRQQCGNALRASLSAGRCRSRLLSRRDPLSDLLDSGEISRARNCDLYGGDPGSQLYWLADLGAILTMDGWFGLRGWHWLFIIEGFPAIVLGCWLSSCSATVRKMPTG